MNEFELKQFQERSVQLEGYCSCPADVLERDRLRELLKPPKPSPALLMPPIAPKSVDKTDEAKS